MSEHAFPIIREDFVEERGITMRDYFAAKALQALIAAEHGDLAHIHGAKDAYRYADAMLEARK